jgi:predicted PurR-regulated permease PerM
MPVVPISTNSLKTKVKAAETPTPNSMMTLAVAVVVIAALYVAREVLIPITLAILLSFVLAPLVAKLRRIGLWRVPSVILAVFVALGIILAVGAIIGTQVAQLGARSGEYAATVESKVGAVRGYITNQANMLSSRLSRTEAAPKPAAQAPRSANEAPKPTVVEVHQPDPTPFEVIERVLTPVLSPLGSLGIMLVVAVFILMQMEDLRDRMIRLFGSGDLHRTTAAMDDAAARLSRYFLTQLALNASFGVVVAIGLFLIGVPSPALFGIVAALFRFIPYVGAVGAGLLPILLAAAVDPGWTMALVTLGLFVVIEGITGQVLEPLAYGHSTGLSPVSVVVSAIFWAWLWGPVGLILSMPLTLLLVVLGRHFEHLQFIDVLLGDTPALTPAESFYQRMLAGDADEALDQAEVLLREQSLSEYYDEVALRGLQMAANDSLRGVLTADQLGNIQDSIGEVVTDLADHEDAGPPAETLPGRPSGTVLCVAGRGPLDEAACLMLAQVLAKRGLNARVVPAGSVARGAIDGLDVSGIDMVCISYLEAAGSMSALRYLTRRLRQRAPGLHTIVGLWQADAALVSEDRMRSMVGADLYTNSLREAVAACVARMPYVLPPEPAAASEPVPDVAGGQQLPDVAGRQQLPDVAGGQQLPDVAGGQQLTPA